MIHTADHEATARRILIATARVDEQFPVESPAEADAVLGRDATVQVDVLAGSDGTWRTLRPFSEVEVILAAESDEECEKKRPTYKTEH